MVEADLGIGFVPREFVHPSDNVEMIGACGGDTAAQHLPYKAEGAAAERRRKGAGTHDNELLICRTAIGFAGICENIAYLSANIAKYRPSY